MGRGGAWRYRTAVEGPIGRLLWLRLVVEDGDSGWSHVEGSRRSHVAWWSYFYGNKRKEGT